MKLLHITFKKNVISVVNMVDVYTELWRIQTDLNFGVTSIGTVYKYRDVGKSTDEKYCR